jgi:hypothetical protein
MTEQEVATFVALKAKLERRLMINIKFMMFPLEHHVVFLSSLDPVSEVWALMYHILDDYTDGKDHHYVCTINGKRLKAAEDLDHEMLLCYCKEGSDTLDCVVDYCPEYEYQTFKQAKIEGMESGWRKEFDDRKE